jgi:predicted nucleic acid-binding protein
VILADTSVWIDHLRKGNVLLTALLENASILAHPFVMGETALGNLRRREFVLGAMADLPRAIVASEEETLRLIENETLFGRGIGYIDAHLLASVRLTAGSRLWTSDRRLQSVAHDLGVAFTP